MPIRMKQTDGVVTLTLDNPGHKNALTTQMFDELHEALRAIASDEEARVVVVCGADGDFCSGADLSESSSGRGHWLPYMRWVAAACTALHDLPKPSIAMVTGVAVGAGANLALGCDLSVAADDARFSEIFVDRGLSLDFGGSYVLPRLVGVNKAKELALLGTMISGKEAARIGLVNTSVPADQVDDVVGKWAQKLAGAPPLAVSMTKRLLDASLGSSLAQALEAEGVAQSLNFASDDVREAFAAYRQGRVPEYRGR